MLHGQESGCVRRIQLKLSENVFAKPELFIETLALY